MPDLGGVNLDNQWTFFCFCALKNYLEAHGIYEENASNVVSQSIFLNYYFLRFSPMCLSVSHGGCE